jgi:hypothetical protein
MNSKVRRGSADFFLTVCVGNAARVKSESLVLPPVASEGRGRATRPSYDLFAINASPPLHIELASGTVRLHAFDEKLETFAISKAGSLDVVMVKSSGGLSTDKQPSINYAGADGWVEGMIADGSTLVRRALTEAARKEEAMRGPGFVGGPTPGTSQFQMILSRPGQADRVRVRMLDLLPQVEDIDAGQALKVLGRPGRNEALGLRPPDGRAILSVCSRAQRDHPAG